MGNAGRINGVDLTPGTTYYVRMRQRDIFGNLSAPSTATSVVIRYTDQAPGAKVFRAALATAMFLKSSWAAYPYHNAGSGGGYDVFGNWTANIVTGTLPAITATPTACFFRMPCDGIAKVHARMGVYNDGSEKSIVMARLGLFRIGSAMPGGTTSVPLFYIGAPAVEGAVASSTAFPLISCASGVGVFLSETAQISAYSGDYLLVGVHTDSSGLFSALAASTTSVSATYIHIHVTQD